MHINSQVAKAVRLYGEWTMKMLWIVCLMVLLNQLCLSSVQVQPVFKQSPENILSDKRRPPMMFINSGFAGGGSKHGHYRRVQKSNNQLGLNHLEKNTKLSNKGKFQKIHINKPSIKGASKFVSIKFKFRS